MNKHTIKIEFPLENSIKRWKECAGKQEAKKNE